MKSDLSSIHLSISPLVGHTDRHFRFLYRLIAPRAILYSEMIVAQAIVYGDEKRLLMHSEEEIPVVAQLGGSDPALMAQAASIAETFDYSAININLGCPSKRVSQGGFGARLMEHPRIVLEVIRAIKRVVTIPVTVKCRIGTDQVGGTDWLEGFLAGLVEEGIDGIVIHARIADLSGRSTAYNLNVPPLDYEIVRQMIDIFPDVPITLNGGLNTVERALEAKQWADRIMVGRMALDSPSSVRTLHGHIFDESTELDAFDIAARFREYMVVKLQEGVPLHAMTRHALKLFNGYRGARSYRRILSTKAIDRNADISVFDEALQHIISSPSPHGLDSGQEEQLSVQGAI